MRIWSNHFKVVTGYSCTLSRMIFFGNWIWRGCILYKYSKILLNETLLMSVTVTALVPCDFFFATNRLLAGQYFCEPVVAYMGHLIAFNIEMNHKTCSLLTRLLCLSPSLTTPLCALLHWINTYSTSIATHHNIESM